MTNTSGNNSGRCHHPEQAPQDICHRIETCLRILTNRPIMEIRHRYDNNELLEPDNGWRDA